MRSSFPVIPGPSCVGQVSRMLAAPPGRCSLTLAQEEAAAVYTSIIRR
jgi:hypothetical protein